MKFVNNKRCFLNTKDNKDEHSRCFPCDYCPKKNILALSFSVPTLSVHEVNALCIAIGTRYYISLYQSRQLSLLNFCHREVSQYGLSFCAQVGKFNSWLLCLSFGYKTSNPSLNCLYFLREVPLVLYTSLRGWKSTPKEFSMDTLFLFSDGPLKQLCNP